MQLRDLSDDLAWKAVLQRLEQQDVSVPVRDAIAGGLGAHDEGDARLVVASLPEATVSLRPAAGSLPLLADYAQERSQAKRACDGLVDVVEALRKAQVQTLIRTTDADRHSTLWFGQDPSQLGTRRADVEALGATSPQEGPLLTALLRAALATGADIQPVPHQSEQSPQSGPRTLLRHADSDV